MSFIQAPPTLGNQFDADAAFRSLLARRLPAAVLRQVQPSLREMGRLSTKPVPAQLATDWASPRRRSGTHGATASTASS